MRSNERNALTDLEFKVLAYIIWKQRKYNRGVSVRELNNLWPKSFSPTSHVNTRGFVDKLGERGWLEIAGTNGAPGGQAAYFWGITSKGRAALRRHLDALIQDLWEGDKKSFWGAIAEAIYQEENMAMTNVTLDDFTATLQSIIQAELPKQEGINEAGLQ